MENIGLMGDKALWTLYTCGEDTVDLSYVGLRIVLEKGKGLAKTHLLGCCVERFCLNSAVVNSILEKILNSLF